MAFIDQAANRDYSKHWTVPGTYPAMMQAQQPEIPKRVCSVVDNYIRCVKGNKPFWMPCAEYEINTVWPDAVEEHPVPEVDGYDWFGVEWVMVEQVGGMMPRPGTRTLSEFANWKEELEMPDLDRVDFETDGKKIASTLDPERAHIFECCEGAFERLHELIPFDETLLAFYEEPELLEEFFNTMIDYKIDICERIFKYYGRVDGVCYHDDWGTQRAGFFSNEMFREQIFPHTKRFMDYLKSRGKFIELHSCGKNEQYMPMMIEMGIDMWKPQFGVNRYDFLYSNYGTQMTFGFQVQGLDDPGLNDADIRRVIRGFVDTWGETGRVMAMLRVSPDHRDRLPIARDELYNYSLEYYNKLYGRN